MASKHKVNVNSQCIGMFALQTRTAHTAGVPLKLVKVLVHDN